MRHGFELKVGAWLAVGILALAGCPADDSSTDTGQQATSSNPDDTGNSSPGTSDGSGGVTTPMGTGSGTGDPTGGPATGGACDMSKELAADCIEDCECMSNKCFFVTGFGGRCSECLGDDDCPDGGCTPPNPLADPPVGAVCNMGAAGEGCETSDVCQDGLVCGVILDAEPILSVSTCGECDADNPCPDGQLCSPTVDLLAFSGENICVDPGTVPNGQACDVVTGNEACESGICHVVELAPAVLIGVCGDCNVDADCTGMQVCSDPDIDTMTGVVTPPMCVDP